MTTTHLWTKLNGRLQRSAASRMSRRPMEIDSPRPIVSFTFDDFPRSALLVGGAILSRFGLAGTYYASFGLMGQTAPTGPIFVRRDLDRLVEQGHELGCHTFDHCHSWETAPALFEASVVRNELARRAMIPRAPFKTLSYPSSPPRPLTKRRAAARFAGCRGGGQTGNVGTTDLNYLAAYFLEKSRDNPEAIKTLIEQNRRDRGWLILATHDVSPDPTPYGCVPEFFEDIVRSVVASGARVLPVGQAIEVLTSPRRLDLGDSRQGLESNP
jgi:peptidoglycan/xylan/chitin deacetylase (PgdA/CDA1 family)